jgi:hypothetical protein
MTPRTARETLDSLRVTLQKLEQTTDPVSDGQDAVQLKTILLNRIAELEALHALQPEEAATAPAPSDLPSIAATAAEEHAREAADLTGLKKLD